MKDGARYYGPDNKLGCSEHREEKQPEDITKKKESLYTVLKL